MYVAEIFTRPAARTGISEWICRSLYDGSFYTVRRSRRCRVSHTHTRGCNDTAIARINFMPRDQCRRKLDETKSFLRAFVTPKPPNKCVCQYCPQIRLYRRETKIQCHSVYYLSHPMQRPCFNNVFLNLLQVSSLDLFTGRYLMHG